MMLPAVSVENVSKRFCLAHAAGERPAYGTFREELVRWASWPARAFSGERNRREDFWALRDVSFDVQPSEVIGIIGRNGAGKSTLLKVLSRITKPTGGRVRLRGRVGSLLEVGTGFHPELSGRENIFLSGAVLGMKRAEIRRKFDEMVAFAEVERFLDTPVKRYSSGMYMRLAFAVAAHLEPEILLVDEVLAVGDVAFQRKCLGKMGEVARGGRTILFVSHNMTAVSNLCERTIWLADGRVRTIGPTKQVLSEYLSSATGPAPERVWDDPASEPGGDLPRLRRVRVRPTEEGGNVIALDTPVEVVVEYETSKPDLLLHVTVLVNTQDEVCAFATVSRPTRVPIGLVYNRCLIPGHLLNTGSYSLRVLIVRDENNVVIDCEQAVSFDVVEREREFNYHGRWPGAVRPTLQWDTRPSRPPGPSGLETTKVL